MERSTALARIASVLQPYLGATMAEASTRAHCEKLGIVGEVVSPAQLESLLAKLGSGLAVFVGREQTAKVMSEIRTSLGVGSPA